MIHHENHHREEFKDSALYVNSGIEKPPIVNPYFKKVKRAKLSVDDYVNGILDGNITILSQAITLVESLLPSHHQMAQQIIERCLPYSGKSIRIGITGVPGAGKSTFIEAIGTKITDLNHKLAVLAIDPSSEKSKGSILGDKTRMETLVHNPKAFIRPSPAAGSLGGVARKTRESVVLCEAAGFDVIFIETVGVGQSETAVHSMVDLFLMLQISGAGDELQGIKRGIMEMADIVAITKSDGENIHRANLTRSHFLNALHLFPLPQSQWRPQVYTCSSVTGDGLMDVWSSVESYISHINKNGYFDVNRSRQARYWMNETIREALLSNFYNNPQVIEQLESCQEDVLNNKVSSFVAAKYLLDSYYANSKQ
ncbi:MAG: methylmalonyl Co-A mutase-associated GTPase MeaB [Rikenellaceae bacterium]